MGLAYDEVAYKFYPVSATKTTAITKGDKVWYDRTNKVAVSARDFPWQGSIAQTQRCFKAAFIGISLDDSPAATNTPAGTFLTLSKIRVAVQGADRAACASVTVEKLSLVAPAQVTATNAISATNVAIVTDLGSAIGKSLNDGAAQTEILYKFEGVVDDVDSLGSDLFVADVGTAAALSFDKGLAKQFMELDIGAGAETNTAGLAVHVGQELYISVKTNGGGSRAITFSAAINTGGNTIMTFSTVGQTAGFKAGSDLKWNLMFTKGAVAS